MSSPSRSAGLTDPHAAAATTAASLSAAGLESVAAGRAPSSARPRIPPQQLGRLLLLLVNTVLIGLAMLGAYGLRFVLDLGEPARAPMLEYVTVAAILAPIILILGQSWGLFRLFSFHSTLEQVQLIAKAVTTATVVVLGLTFFDRGFTYSRLVFLYFVPICVVALTAAQVGFRSWQQSRYRRGLDRRRALLVGASSYLAARLAQEEAFGLDVVGRIDVDVDASPDLSRPRGLLASAVRSETESVHLPELGKLSDLDEMLDPLRIEEVVVVEQGLTHRALLECIDACERRGVMVRLVPAIYDLLVEPDDFSYVHGVPLLRVDERRYHWLARFTKRVFDLLMSSLLLLLLLPVFALLWALIRLDSKGPALFKQVRAGEGGRPFRMLKFRTMVVDAEQQLRKLVDLDALDQPMFKLKRDPRITRLGGFLRRTSLDELPQLWNVLMGHMSLVGPRPEELRIVERYDVWQRRRLKVKPGITGLQQVEARGALSDLNERVRLDVYYIRKQCLLLDLVILARTFGAVARGSGAS
ncbi:MAG: sugar transferase [Planctomycetota bacterium]